MSEQLVSTARFGEELGLSEAELRGALKACVPESASGVEDALTYEEGFRVGAMLYLAKARKTNRDAALKLMDEAGIIYTNRTAVVRLVDDGILSVKLRLSQLRSDMIGKMDRARYVPPPPEPEKKEEEPDPGGRGSGAPGDPGDPSNTTEE